MQAANANSFSFSTGTDLASQNALMQGLGINPQAMSSNSQGAMGGFMQNQQSIGYPIFDQSMQSTYQSAQNNLGMNQFNPMMMQQGMGHQFQGYGMPQNAMGFQIQQQMMNGANQSMLSSMGDQMSAYGGMNPQAIIAQTLQGAQMQNAYGSNDAMSMALQGMMGSNRGQSNNSSGNYNSHGGGNNQRFNSNNQNKDDGALRLNTVYISDLPQGVDHDMIRDNFSKVGSIKLNSKSGMPMIWIFKDRGVPKGDALVTYDSNSSATNAISYFKENDFNGSTIEVRIATNNERPILAPPSGEGGNDGGNRGGFTNNNNWSKNDGGSGGFNRSRGGGGGGSGGDYRGNRGGGQSGGGGDKNRGPDWMCAKCNNNNFSWRESCNRCQEPKSEDAVEVHGQDRGFSGGGAPRSNNRMVHKNSTGQDGGPMRGPRKTSSRPGPY